MLLSAEGHSSDESAIFFYISGQMLVYTLDKGTFRQLTAQDIERGYNQEFVGRGGGIELPSKSAALQLMLYKRFQDSYKPQRPGYHVSSCKSHNRALLTEARRSPVN